MIFDIQIKYLAQPDILFSNHLHISTIVLGKIYEMSEERVTPLVYNLSNFVTVGVVVGFLTTDNSIWSLGAYVLCFIRTAILLCLCELTKACLDLRK